MNLLRYGPLRHREPSADRLIRLFQSETSEISETPVLVRANATLYILGALFASLIIIAAVMQMDRVVTSTLGVVVTT